MASVRPIRGQEWRELRDIRLRALADAPWAFSSKHSDERRFSDETWRERASRGAAGRTAGTFVAVIEGIFCGLITIIVSEQQAALAEIHSLWVDPAHRREGIGGKLLRATEAWALEHGIEQLELSVTQVNEPARRFYELAGYRDTGRTTVEPGQEPETVMVKRLGTGACCA